MLAEFFRDTGLIALLGVSIFCWGQAFRLAHSYINNSITRLFWEVTDTVALVVFTAGGIVTMAGFSVWAGAS